MGDVLAESIKSLPATPDLELDRINLLWSLVVGEEIGSRSRVVKTAKGTLFVEVKGQEWVPVVHTYERKILAKLNKIFDSKGFMEIIVKQVEGVPISSKKPLKISATPSYTQPMDKHDCCPRGILEADSGPRVAGASFPSEYQTPFCCLGVGECFYPCQLRFNASPPAIPKRYKWMREMRCLR